ncbi:hypothetical protein [Runella zeae]|uniref:hypothetical protein n=1 Tax=Runella zeae TaxID=94255 RepID=UPI00048C1A6A|nr:hypothetical protein [Runella zeae]
MKGTFLKMLRKSHVAGSDILTFHFKTEGAKDVLYLDIVIPSDTIPDAEPEYFAGLLCRLRAEFLKKIETPQSPDIRIVYPINGYIILWGNHYFDSSKPNIDLEHYTELFYGNKETL